MSIIKSIKQVLGLGPAAENHHWDGSVPNQLSLRRGTPDAPGTELIKALNGVLSFPNQGQSLAPNGYVKLPGGLIIQWLSPGDLVSGSAVTFPIPFPTACLSVVGTPIGAVSNTIGIEGMSTTGFNQRMYNSTNAAGVTWSARYIAIGY